MEQNEIRSGIFDLGTFEGFNFRDQCAIFECLTASDVMEWDHDGKGEAEFWPTGDRPEISLLFRTREVTGSELRDLEWLLQELGSDSRENLLLIHYAVNILGTKLEDLTGDAVQENCVQIFVDSTFVDVRREAAYELFELYYPEEYRIWESSTCDSLIFDVDRFLDSPSFATEEITLGNDRILLVAPQ